MKSFVLATLSTLAITSGLSLFTATSVEAAPKGHHDVGVKVKPPVRVKPHVVVKPTPQHHYGKPGYRPPAKPVYVGKPGYRPPARPIYVGKPGYRPPARPIYIGKPYRGSLSYWAHPIASAIAFAILVNTTTGELQDEKGNNVVVLGDGGEVKQTYQQDGTVYIITG